MGIFDKIKNFVTLNKDKNKYLSGFNKTNNKIEATLKNVESLTKQQQENFMENMMITLLESDVGYETSEKICNIYYEKIRYRTINSKKELKYALYETMYEIYGRDNNRVLNINPNGPTVIMMVGVNGSGKTTTVAKLANIYKLSGKKVAVVAGDTFRAGAIKQLETWAEKIGVDCISGLENEDPSSVLVKGCRFAKENNIDILICDTAGRLQNKINLMNELNKMNKVLNKEIPGAPFESYLVIDANTGQNGINQAKLFSEVTNLTGIILTKMDGSSKGGIVIGIKDQVKIPVNYIGLGEGIDDLSQFEIELYLYGMLGDLQND